LEYQKEGYLPDALLNYLVRLGWSHGDQELFTREQMIAAFDIKDVKKSASAFNPEKLLWLNQQHIMRAPDQALTAGLRAALRRSGMRLAPEDEPLLVGVATAQRERARTFKEMAQNSEFFFRDFDSYDEKAASRNLTITTLPYLTALYDALESLADWNASSINERINSVASANGVGL